MLKQLEKNLGLAFSNKNLLKLALTHRSILNEKTGRKRVSNERLEFLGDSILSFLTSSYLYGQFPSLDEGRLTALRSALVRTETLAQLSKKLDLNRYLILSRGEKESGGRQNQGILADTFEAFLGALFLDQGLKICEIFLKENLFVQTEQIIKSKTYQDYKSELQELVQDRGFSAPNYRVLKEIGPDHKKQFTSGVFVNNKLVAKGRGMNKQKAEQEAAKKALKIWRIKENRV